MPSKKDILKCGAKIEAKEHAWASRATAMRIAMDHGPGEYPECGGKKNVRR